MRSIAAPGLVGVYLGIVLGLLACQPKPVAPGPFEGSYDYTAYDADGRAVLVGSFDLRASPGNPAGLVGAWDFRTIDPEPGIPPVNAAALGPHLGAGQLEASPRGAALAIVLQPNSLDNQVILTGTKRNGIFVGQWQHFAFGSVRAEGTFTAVVR